MPDHIHASVAIDDRKLNLSTWGKSFKNSISKTLRQKAGGKIGRFKARSSRSNIVLSEDSAVTDRRYSCGAADV
jgi:hypothetical protein